MSPEGLYSPDFSVVLEYDWTSCHSFPPLSCFRSEFPFLLVACSANDFSYWTTHINNTLSNVKPFSSHFHILFLSSGKWCQYTNSNYCSWFSFLAVCENVKLATKPQINHTCALTAWRLVQQTNAELTWIFQKYTTSEINLHCTTIPICW